MTGPGPAATPSEITPEWLTAALTAGGRFPNARVAAVKTTPLGTGQMCDSLRLEITYESGEGCPATMVAKLPAADQKTRATAVMMRCYEKEVRFYRELAAQLEISTPEVYFSALDDSDLSRFTLLLEDLHPASQGDQLTGCSVSVAESALSELVGLHAPFWGDRRIEKIEWLVSTPESRRSMATLMPVLWSAFVDRYSDSLEDHVLEAGSLLFQNLDEYFTRDDPLTVVHGDYRLDNLLIYPDGNVCGVVDWQTCTTGPAMGDVAYFIGAGLLEEDRREHEERLVRDYYERLVSIGVTGMSWNFCWEAYRRSTFAGLMMAVGAAMMVERSEHGDEMFLTMASRHSLHVIDLKAGELVKRA